MGKKCAFCDAPGFLDGRTWVCQDHYLPISGSYPAQATITRIRADHDALRWRLAQALKEIRAFNPAVARAVMRRKKGGGS